MEIFDYIGQLPQKAPESWSKSSTKSRQSFEKDIVFAEVLLRKVIKSIGRCFQLGEGTDCV